MSEDRRVAIVTGATRGIGRAVAHRVAQDGYAVVVNYRGEPDSAQGVCDEISAAGGEAVPMRADVTDSDQIADMVKGVMDQFGRVDALVNNAGITRDTLFMRMKDEDWDAVIQTNLRSAYLCSKAVIRPMMRQRSGAIVNMTSVVGLVGNPGQANYAAAKAGLIGLTKSLAKEVGSRGIRVNAVAPGFIDTRLTNVLSDEIRESAIEMIPLGRFGEPEDVAGAVAFLLGSESHYITGNVLSVDGGLFMAT
ncbi:MAG: 3-oxoacyl-[acyl-carrier-protein] reductase [Chloroflexota bacterium]